jgi:hypothetical protein
VLLLLLLLLLLPLWCGAVTPWEMCPSWKWLPLRNKGHQEPQARQQQ